MTAYSMQLRYGNLAFGPILTVTQFQQSLSKGGKNDKRQHDVVECVEELKQHQAEVLCM